MQIVLVRSVVLGVALFAVPLAQAQNKCTAKGVMGGQKFELAHCEVAVYSASGATIWFSSTPITSEERALFQRSSSNDRFKQGRTMVTVFFCPGGGAATPSPATAKSVEIAFKHATVADLGPQDQWVLEPRSDKQIKVERLTGDLKSGGKLSGKMTGADRQVREALQLGPRVRRRGARQRGGRGAGLLTRDRVDFRPAGVRRGVLRGG